MPFARPPFVVLICGFGLMLAEAALAQGEDQGLGTWKVNIARSKLGPGPPPRSVTSTIEVVGLGGARITGVRIGADGQRTEAQYTARYDGRDYPIRGSANADTVALRRVDARTVERTDKRAGKVVETSTTVFSEDGKTSTTTGKGRDARGEEFQYVAVNEKQ